ncbi:hypothetical protein [Aneurinibacillus tyrosinisolvens]|uniref:hypothetical protein n=1 Tax=Aneurinibacillus tyrosinisolvens TaxID=1443435 RepID=UPI00063F0481|nr:hypothetical protein [Aneurinibacillus tyrosinisolvens]
MTMLWITPIVHASNGWVLKEERKPYSEQFLRPLCERLRAIHPRLLPLVKAAILPDEPDEPGCERPFCGTAADFTLAEQGDITFDGQTWLLSHCGEQFLDSLLSPLEALSLLQKADDLESPPTAEVLQFIAAWLQSGFHVILIKE